MWCYYGIASMDEECPKGMYRYTLGVKQPPERPRSKPPASELFSFPVGSSEWVVFDIEHFGSQYGVFWQQDPYAVIKQLGYEYNKALSIHIDVYAPPFASEDDGMEFMMPIQSVT